MSPEFLQNGTGPGGGGGVVCGAHTASCLRVCEVWSGAVVRVFALHCRPMAAVLTGVLGAKCCSGRGGGGCLSTATA